MSQVRVNAPAKVNTLLRVIGRREDGYHDLEMVMVPLSLCDEITLTATGGGITISVDGQADDGMAGERNLAFRAARAFIEHAGVKAGVAIELTKRVPVAAGLGGGSSDAAAVLRGLNSLWGVGLTVDELAGIGARLGADVPFFCHRGPAFVEGIGDRVSVYETFPKCSYLLINPGFPLSTPWVYDQWDLQLTMKPPDARVRPLFQVFSDVIASLHNDLERVTIPAHPEIGVIKGALMESGAAGALMSGSGPTVFGVFSDAVARDRAHAQLDREGWRIYKAEARLESSTV
ncbi:MAG: 4-(cytidine 5'-diphospho)-2-C-methyl-D-erythritol kinase [Proteobacteria bacterium]|nr:4-(cytidine 5'-diphospho)-2-C-methyl-D-erythritol kinase [Pseudomonadota bacterium]